MKHRKLSREREGIIQVLGGLCRMMEWVLGCLGIGIDEGHDEGHDEVHGENN